MKKRWNIATLAAACSTMGFCVATGENAPVDASKAIETNAAIAVQAPTAEKAVDDQNLEQNQSDPRE